MSGSSLFDYLKDAAQDGTSIWVYLGKKNLTLVCSNINSIPKLNSNNVYVVVNSRHGVQVLGDRSYNSTKVYFWIGARNIHYNANFSQLM